MFAVRLANPKSITIPDDHLLTKEATGTIWEGGYSDVSRFYNHAHRQLQSPLVIPGISDAGAHLNM